MLIFKVLLIINLCFFIFFFFIFFFFYNFCILYSELYELRARHDKELLHKPAISKHKIIPSQSFNSNLNSSSLIGNILRYLGNIPYFFNH